MFLELLEQELYGQQIALSKSYFLRIVLGVMLWKNRPRPVLYHMFYYAPVSNLIIFDLRVCLRRHAQI